MRKRSKGRKTVRKKVEGKKKKTVRRKKLRIKTKTKKKNIKDARVIPKEKYQELLKKKKLTNKEKKILDKALFLNYCKCIKSIKYSRVNERGAEYPICLSSIYLRRGKNAPKGIVQGCKNYL